MKLDSKKLGILALATGGVGLLAYFLLNRANGEEPHNCPPGFVWNEALNACVPNNTGTGLIATADKTSYTVGEMVTITVVHTPTPIQGQPVFVTMDGQHLGERGTTGSTGTFVFQTAFSNIGNHSLSFQSSGYTANLTVEVQTAPAPQFLNIEHNSAVVGSWAGIIVTVNKANAGEGAWSYTLSMPTVIGAQNQNISSGVDGGSYQVRQQFYFPPGTHTITGTVTGSANSLTDSLTFEVIQNPSGNTFTVNVLSP